MWTSSEIEQIRDLLENIINDADGEIIYALRKAGNSNPYQNVANVATPRRETLLAELDALERVRERLNVRFDSLTVHPDGRRSVN